MMALSTFDTLEAALEAKAEGQVVSAVFKHRQMKREELLASQPDIFFLAPAEASDDQMRQLAWEARHGEPMDPDEVRYQASLLKQAQEMT